MSRPVGTDMKEIPNGELGEGQSGRQSGFGMSIRKDCILHDAGRERRTKLDLEIKAISCQETRKTPMDALAFSSSPTTVKNPPNDSASGSVGVSLASKPTSTVLSP